MSTQDRATTEARPVPVLVFAKPPRPGRAKTRLGAEIGADRAAEFAAAFLADTLDRAVAELAEPIVLVGDGEPADFAATLPDGVPSGVEFLPQGDGDLGARLRRAIAATLETGAAGAIALGADTPHLPLEWVARAADAVREGRHALGPSDDGGYYLVGVPAGGDRPELFEGHPWGEPGVLESTRQSLAALGLDCLELPAFWDIDHRCDLVQWERQCARVSGRADPHEDGALPRTPPVRSLRLLAADWPRQ